MDAIIPPLLAFVAHYRYATLFSVALFEGTATTIGAGILISLGHLSFWPTLGVIVFGDLIADTVLYLIGRFGREIARRLPFFRRNEHHLETIERHYHGHTFRTLLLGKLSYGLSGASLVAAGGAKLPYQKFIPRVAILDAAKASLFLGIGWYFGKSALGIRHYLPYYTLAVVIIILIAYFLLRRRKSKNERKEEVL